MRDKQNEGSREWIVEKIGGSVVLAFCHRLVTLGSSLTVPCDDGALTLLG